MPNNTAVFGDSEKGSLTLVEKIKVSHDSYIFKFGLPEGKTFGAPLGAHCKFFAEIDGEMCRRSYTPISDVQQRGTVDFVIKVYRPTAEFPKGGKMTLYLEALKVGDKLGMMGFGGKLNYFGNGNFTVSREPALGKVTRKQLGFIAGGTGIAPCWHVLQASARHDDGC